MFVLPFFKGVFGGYRKISCFQNCRSMKKDLRKSCNMFREVVDSLKVKLPHKNSGFRLEGKAERNPPA